MGSDTFPERVIVILPLLSAIMTQALQPRSRRPTTRRLKGLLDHHTICFSFSSWNKNMINWQERKLQAWWRKHSALVKPMEEWWYILTIRRGENMLDCWRISQAGNLISHYQVILQCKIYAYRCSPNPQLLCVPCWNVARITQILHLIILSWFNPPPSFSQQKPKLPIHY